ncbi:MAG: hypothetical protein ACTSPI_00425 [Candidatus Heimdallarchaeaceae archaeon]
MRSFSKEIRKHGKPIELHPGLNSKTRFVIYSDNEIWEFTRFRIGGGKWNWIGIRVGGAVNQLYRK